MKTPNNATPEFLAALETLGYTPARWDSPATRLLDVKNAEGHPTVRVAIEIESSGPNRVSIYKFCGTKARLTEWECNLSAYMPTASIFAMLQTF